jgi:hypothetical protein
MFRMRSPIPCLAVAVLLGGEPTPQGLRVAQRLDAMDVEHHWLAGEHVDWRTGLPDTGRSGKTHCSAFVAAACERLGVYILRPPEHRMVHLATAQAEWLQQEGASHGWTAVPSPFQAQDLANQGRLVVAAFPSPDPSKHGHIALVRPSAKDAALLETEGPQIIQAGTENATSTTVKAGFRHHRGAWVSAADQRILFFAHALP